MTRSSATRWRREYGREVKHTGDGIMASFMSPAAAVRAAARIQTELERLTASIRTGRSRSASAQPIEHHHDLFGSTVQLAARLCLHAEPEQILVSNVVVEL
jgi:class 3 adenylate cyclase